MPNHVTNELIFRCGADKQAEILKHVWSPTEREGKGGVDFPPEDEEPETADTTAI